MVCGIPICVVTDLVDEARSSGLFDLVLPHPQPVYSYRDKISPLPNYLWQQVFFNSDAFLTYTVTDIFELSSTVISLLLHHPLVILPDGRIILYPNIWGIEYWLFFSNLIGRFVIFVDLGCVYMTNLTT